MAPRNTMVALRIEEERAQDHRCALHGPVLQVEYALTSRRRVVRSDGAAAPGSDPLLVAALASWSSVPNHRLGPAREHDRAHLHT
jgi:hypothetical protein